VSFERLIDFVTPCLLAKPFGFRQAMQNPVLGSRFSVALPCQQFSSPAKICDVAHQIPGGNRICAGPLMGHQ